jgi:hypothetical protein
MSSAAFAARRDLAFLSKRSASCWRCDDRTRASADVKALPPPALPTCGKCERVLALCTLLDCRCQAAAITAHQPIIEESAGASRWLRART